MYSCKTELSPLLSPIESRTKAPVASVASWHESSERAVVVGCHSQTAARSDMSALERHFLSDCRLAAPVTRQFIMFDWHLIGDKPGWLLRELLNFSSLTETFTWNLQAIKYHKTHLAIDFNQFQLNKYSYWQQYFKNNGGSTVYIV